MNTELLNILVCPTCKSKLEHLENSNLLCASCNAEYTIYNGIPRLATDDYYTDNFSMEWERHPQTLMNTAVEVAASKDFFFTRTGFTENDLKGKLVLDAGCGAGRFTEIAHDCGSRIVGMDLSFSVEQAQQNIGQFPDVAIVQADILHPPFERECFDTIFSLGVLHHTSNAELAFQRLSLLLKPGGRMSVWLYSNDGWRMQVYNAIAAFYRFFTTRMPHDLLHRLCHIAVPLYYVHRIPVIGRISRVLLPTSIVATPDGRILDTFDWYSARYQSKHTFKEIERWFKRAGFKDIKRLSVRYEPGDVSVTGIKE